MRTTPRLPVLALLLVLIGAGCSGDESSAPQSALRVVSPSSGAQVVSDVATLEVLAGKFTSVRARVGETSIAGVKSGESFFVFDVPLVGEETRVSIEASEAGKPAVTHTVIVKRGSGAEANVYWETSAAAFSSVPAKVTFRITTEGLAAAKQLLVDFDGDGVFDHRGPMTSELSHSYTRFGHFRPRFVVRTNDNVLYSSDVGEHARMVRIVPPMTSSETITTLERVPHILDLEYDPSTKRLFVLAADGPSVRVLDAELQLVRVIPLPPGSKPLGIGLDRKSNLYVAASGTHRIFRLLATSNYAPDPELSNEGSFGGHGKRDGELDAPTDVAVLGFEARFTTIVVSDTGNHRMQLFDVTGKHVASLDGGATRLVKPTRLCATSDHSFVVVDAGDQTLRFMSTGGRTTASVPKLFGGDAGIAMNQVFPGFVLSDPAGSRVVLLQLGGEVHQVLSNLGGAPAAALLLPRVERPLLVVADSQGKGLRFTPFAQDLPDQTPKAIVTKFLSALAAKDFETAKTFLTDERRKEFEAALEKAGAKDGLQSFGKSVSNLSTPMIGLDNARVVGEQEVNSRDRYSVVFVLSRGSGSGAWRLHDF